jgi:hypothetical protein
MAQSRTLLLFDPNAQPQCWNERMSPTEYAVLYSHQPNPSGHPDVAPTAGPSCTIFSTLSEAEEYAAQQVALIPTLRCRIYDHHGLAVQPIREIRGSQHKGESEISARFRRRAGSILFFGGLALVVLDWTNDFKLSWPATIGIRMFPVGLVLLVTELVIVITTRRAHRDGPRDSR